MYEFEFGDDNYGVFCLLSLSLVSWLWLVVESVTLFLLFVSLVCNYSFYCIDNTACFYTLLLLAMFVR